MVTMRNFLFAAMMLLASACVAQNTDDVARAAVGGEAGQTRLSADQYKLSPGDTVRVVTYKDESLSGAFTVDDSGQINMPLLGAVDANGLTRRELEVTIADALKKGYLVDPKVSVDVVKFRPFYIVGEVQHPGSYDYAVDLSVLKAVAIAGGFTPRASTGSFTVYRGSGKDLKKIDANESSLILPGDSIRVDERFF